jgi:hypothetical protein
MLVLLHSVYAAMAIPLDPTNDIEYWKEEYNSEDRKTTGLCIPWKDLISGTSPNSDLKVRRVYKARLNQKCQQIRNKYLANMPMCVRNNGNGTYTVFDGNHRYHAIAHWIKVGAGLPQNPYTEGYLVPCNVYRKDTPSDLCMRYGSMTNDVQLCASGGTLLDFMRFLTNTRNHMQESEG